jgi:hypothetical protein
MYIQLSSIFLISYGVSKFNAKHRAWARRFLIAAFMLHFGLVLLQLMGKDPFFHSIRNVNLKETVGFMASPDQSGALASLLSPILFLVNPVLSVMSLMVIVLSKSFFSFSACVISLMVSIYFLFRKWTALFAIFFIALGILYCSKIDIVNYSQASARLGVWEYAISSVSTGRLNIENDSYVKCNMLTGFGFGNFLTLFPKVPTHASFNYVNEKFSHAHNDVVEFTFETGILGGLVMLAFLFSVIIGFVFSQKDPELITYFCCLLAYLINAMGNFSSQIAVLGLYGGVIYGMYEGRRRELNG